MKNRLLFPLIYGLLVFLTLSGCSNDEPGKEHINLYFHDAGIAYQNGDYDKAVKYYKLFLASNSNEDEALLEFVNLQLARISFSKGNYDESLWLNKYHCDGVSDSSVQKNRYILVILESIIHSLIP